MQAALAELNRDGAFWTQRTITQRGRKLDGSIVRNRSMLERLVLLTMPFISKPPPAPIRVASRPSPLQLPPACDGPMWGGLRPKPLRIVDVFPFGWELDLLEIRLFEYEHVVDSFVVFESGFADRGFAKPLFFAANVARFRRFRRKILHVVQDDATYLSNPRRRGAAARASTSVGPDWTNAVVRSPAHQ